MTKQDLLHKIYRVLQREPDRMYSREEILNLLGEKGKDEDLESLLAELEVSSSFKESSSDIYATCRGGTIYYKWNQQ